MTFEMRGCVRAASAGKGLWWQAWRLRKVVRLCVK